MKAVGIDSLWRKGFGQPRRGGFTLSELLVAMAIFLLVIAGTFSAHLFGLKMMGTIEKAAITSRDDQALVQCLADDISAAKSWEVGSGSSAAFTAVTVNQLQMGNALCIFPACDTNQFIRYYRDPAADLLYRLTNSSSRPVVVASLVTNLNIFANEDYQGKILSNRIQSGVLNLTLQFQNAPTGTWGEHSAAIRVHELKAKFNSRPMD